MPVSDRYKKRYVSCFHGSMIAIPISTYWLLCNNVLCLLLDRHFKVSCPRSLFHPSNDIFQDANLYHTDGLFNGSLWINCLNLGYRKPIPHCLYLTTNDCGQEIFLWVPHWFQDLLVGRKWFNHATQKRSITAFYYLQHIFIATNFNHLSCYIHVPCKVDTFPRIHSSFKFLTLMQ